MHVQYTRYQLSCVEEPTLYLPRWRGWEKGVWLYKQKIISFTRWAFNSGGYAEHNFLNLRSALSVAVDQVLVIAPWQYVSL